MNKFVIALGVVVALGVAGAYLAGHPQRVPADVSQASSTPLAGLPNPHLTPGVINPDVTQANIDSTICVRGWTRTVRPPEHYPEQLKHRQIAEYGYADRRLGHYEKDHLISLELGGSPADPRNLWPDPHHVAGGWGSFTKGRLKNALREMVCEHRITLAQAQDAIAQNWIGAYLHVFPASADR
jgi:hypothetical protein